MGECVEEGEADGEDVEASRCFCGKTRRRRRRSEPKGVLGGDVGLVPDEPLKKEAQAE